MVNKSKVFLFGIILLGIFLRLFGNNWDQGWHLHPDERFLTMVGIDVKIPVNLSTYLDQYKSSFNPVNKGHGFFVYGTFPLLINKVLAQYLYNDTYDLFNLQGRMLSGIADSFVILIIYKLLGLVEKKLNLSPLVKYFAALLYAIAVLPIQLSHFFAVDTFLNLFCWVSFYFSVKIVVNKKESLFSNMFLSGLFFGMAIACKVSALFFAPLIGIFLIIGMYERGWRFMFKGVGLFILSSYSALRFGSPYYFETSTISDFRLSKIFLNSIAVLKSFDNPAIMFPPANQWIHASPFLSLTNLIFFGVGPFYFLLSILGFILLLRQKKLSVIYLVLLWVIGFIFYQSIQVAKTMRYLIFIYPFMAIFAAIAIDFLYKRFNKLPKQIKAASIGLIIVLVLYWPLAFMSIYTKDHSRVAASKWIFNTIPANSKLTYEYWDDPLPLMVQDPSSRNYQTLEIHIFDPDTTEKWNTLKRQLNEADYYIMSSNRGWGSIPKTPERYPIASKFYEGMLEGKGQFKLLKEFSSYPSLRYLGISIEFPDQWSEEAFTVYDHPLVYIFKKNI